MTKIIVHEFHIQDVHDTSGVFHGQNFQHQFRHSRKINDAFGTVHGERNSVQLSLGFVNDQDWVDTYITRRPTRG